MVALLFLPYLIRYFGSLAEMLSCVNSMSMSDCALLSLSPLPSLRMFFPFIFMLLLKELGPLGSGCREIVSCGCENPRS